MPRPTVRPTTRSRRRAWLAVPAAFVLAGGVGPALAPAADAPRPARVTGYVVADDGASRTLRRAAATVDDVGIDGASLTRDARGIVVADGTTAALAAARVAGRPAALLVSNFDDRKGDFSPALGSRLLRDPERRASVVRAVAAEVGGRGWSGATVDLEALRPGDRSGLVAFVSALRAALPPGKTVDLDVPAAPTAGDEQLRPFDLPGLAAAADSVVLMAYDQHYQGGTPGPIGGLPWFRRTVSVALRGVPAAKLRVGVAGYGYRWHRGRATTAVTVARARALAGGRARWIPKQGEWTARLRDGSVIWWSDARSVRARTRVAVGSGTAGIALWRLGAADPMPRR